MSNSTEAILLIALILATSIWVGGYIAIAVVANAAIQTLDASARVAFFRSLGRKYLWVGSPALVVALVTGGVLGRHSDNDGLLISSVIVATVLLASFAVAVGQARRMTRLRQLLVASPDDSVLQRKVAQGGRAATGLRGALGVLSIALVVLGSCLAIR